MDRSHVRKLYRILLNGMHAFIDDVLLNNPEMRTALEALATEETVVIIKPLASCDLGRYNHLAEMSLPEAASIIEDISRNVTGLVFFNRKYVAPLERAIDIPVATGFVAKRVQRNPKDMVRLKLISKGTFRNDSEFLRALGICAMAD